MDNDIRTEDMGRRGPLPKKRMKIADWVRREIVRGKFAAGERLPDRKWFEANFAANQHSVQTAFDLLSDEGFVKAVPGHGTCVAKVLPYDGKFLLILHSDTVNAGSHLFAEALKESAKIVSSRRNVEFEIAAVPKSEEETQAYDAFLARVRAHRYAGVFAQTIAKWRGENVVTNIDDVPIAFIGKRDEHVHGSLVVGIESETGIYTDVYRRHFASCRDAGKRKVAVFAAMPVGDVPVEEAEFRQFAKRNGVDVVPCGYQIFSMRAWNEVSFKYFLDLFFASDAGRSAEAVVLSDDNFLAPFAERCRAAFGADAEKRYLILSHCNRPHPPKTDIPAVFHGIDWPTVLSNFVTYATAIRHGDKNAIVPKVVLF